VNRRILTLIVALVPIVVFGALLAVVTVPFVSLGPGPAFDTLGEVDGKQVVDIKGTTTHPTSGHLDMTTVSQRDDLSLGEAMTLWISGEEQLMPRDLVYPPGKSREQIDKDNDADFKESEHSAEYAALGYLKYPEAITVAAVSDPGPSVGKLQAGDAVQAVNGTPVATVDQFTSLLKHTKPGQPVAIGFRRKNAAPGVAQITLGSHPGRDYGFAGVSVMDASRKLRRGNLGEVARIAIGQGRQSRRRGECAACGHVWRPAAELLTPGDDAERAIRDRAYSCDT
jgi:PDZ domain-containing protein